MWPEQPDKWPKGIRANGHLMLNSMKVGCWFVHIIFVSLLFYFKVNIFSHIFFWEDKEWSILL